MALEAVVYQQADPFGHPYNYNGRDRDSFFHPNFLQDASDFIPFKHQPNQASYHFHHDYDYECLLENSQSAAEVDNWPSSYNNYDDYYCYCFNTTTSNGLDSSVSPPPPPLPLDDDHHDDDGYLWGPGPGPISSSPHQQRGEDGLIDIPGGVEADQVRTTRPKRRRGRRTKKNQEELENQRMTHIAVERNRRKQMNDYLNVLRSIMPDSYVHRGDQASIIGGAINYVKELEQNLQCLTANKHMNQTDGSSPSCLPFGDFFTFPQYSTTAVSGGAPSSGNCDVELKGAVSHQVGGGEGGDELGVDVEVTMVESHALVKIRTKQPPKQLSKLVCGLQSLRLTILHLNATKVDGVAFYSFSVKVEDESILSSVDEIASAVYQLLGRIQGGKM